MAEPAEVQPAEPAEVQPSAGANYVRGAIVNTFCLGLIVGCGFATNTWPLACVSVGVNWLVYLVHALPQSSEKFFDATGTLTYVTLTISAVLLSPNRWTNYNVRQLVQAAMVLVWSLRLGSYLLARILRDGKDARFDALKTNWLRWLGIWSFQALWCFLVSLPVLVILSKEEACTFGFEIGPITVLDIIGWAVWVFAFAFEVIADRQKDAWRQDPANKGKFITVGLWAYSRHPNYFGEILMWVGICISGASCFYNFDWLSLMSPITTFVLLNYVSGVPLLEATAKQRWGNDPAWQWYTEKTPCIFPAFVRPPPYESEERELTNQLGA